jgi:hypothetical protein
MMKNSLLMFSILLLVFLLQNGNSFHQSQYLVRSRYHTPTRILQLNQFPSRYLHVASSSVGTTRTINLCLYSTNAPKEKEPEKTEKPHQQNPKSVSDSKSHGAGGSRTQKIINELLTFTTRELKELVTAMRVSYFLLFSIDFI